MTAIAPLTTAAATRGNHPHNARGLYLSSNDNCKLVHEPGGNTFNAEDGSARDNGTDISSRSDNVP